MKCEKCKNENISIISKTYSEKNILWLNLFCLVIGCICFLIIIFIIATLHASGITIDKFLFPEQVFDIKLSDLLNITQIFSEYFLIISIRKYLIAPFIFFVILIIFKALLPYKTKTKILAVCQNCAHNWEIYDTTETEE